MKNVTISMRVLTLDVYNFKGIGAWSWTQREPTFWASKARPWFKHMSEPCQCVRLCNTFNGVTRLASKQGSIVLLLS